MAGFATFLTKEVLLLGLLKRGPAYGYRIKQIVRDELEAFAPISSGAVYHTLRTLERKGLVRKHAVREGAHPEKHVYEITPAGDESFQSLFRLNTSHFARPQLALDTSLYFLDHADRARFIRELESLKTTLEGYHREAEGFLERLERSGAPCHIVAIPRHYLAHSRAELDFLADLITEISPAEAARS